jgi:hypothetical protein
MIKINVDKIKSSSSNTAEVKEEPTRPSPNKLAEDLIKATKEGKIKKESTNKKRKYESIKDMKLSEHPYFGVINEDDSDLVKLFKEVAKDNVFGDFLKHDKINYSTFYAIEKNKTITYKTLCTLLGCIGYKVKLSVEKNGD